jgi:3-deoxy-D-manno-octulosonic-acid transferase
VLLNLTIGELQTIETVSDVTVVGNTWIPGNDGHNLVESVFRGTPVLFGRYVGFHHPYVSPIRRSGAGIECHNMSMVAKLLLKIANDSQRTLLNPMKAATKKAGELIDMEVTEPALRPLIQETLKIGTPGKGTTVGLRFDTPDRRSIGLLQAG